MMKKGMTLIEIVISFAILGIIILLISSLLSFSLLNFDIGLDQRDEQFDVRLAADYITAQLRYIRDDGNATSHNEIEVLGAVDNVAGYSYLYYENNNLKFKDSSGAIVSFTDDFIQSVSFTLRTDTSTDTPNVYVDFTVSGVNGYQIDSSVYLTNLKWTNITSQTGTVVKFIDP